MKYPLQALAFSLLLSAASLAVAQDPAAPAPAPAPAEAAPAPVQLPPEAAPPPPPAEPAPAAPAPPAPIAQVQIQVTISEINESALRELGANINYTRMVRGVEQTGSVRQVTTNVIDTVSGFERVTLPAPTPGTSLRPDEDNNPANSVQTREGFGLSAGVINTGYGTIETMFRGAEEKGDVDLISKPELLVVNGATATIQAGGEVPYQNVTYAATGVPQLKVEWKKTGVNLTLSPNILPNNTVKLTITDLNVTDVVRIDNIRGVDLPVFSTRSQKGVVLVPDGGNAVIGGLSSRVVRKSERRVPFLGNLPIVGFPFRSRSSDLDVTHLIIFVTPTVVDLRNMSPLGLRAMNFWQERGNEWANVEEIRREFDAMQDNL
ncbi:MAG: type II and III secretion system protein [Candidatus Hydrogenedentes bacterium]|nr:type II and III secretion system protein [Candidatus Hydrogenedentota bacterium]